MKIYEQYSNKWEYETEPENKWVWYCYEKKYLLIFYENYLRKSMSSFRQYHLSSSGNKQNQKKKEINCRGILIDDDVYQFDRSKGKKTLVLSLNQWYINSS